MTALLADLAVRELGHDALAPFDDGALFENVNTPHDYARARDLGDWMKNRLKIVSRNNLL
jgi:hypothetical protein